MNRTPKHTPVDLECGHRLWFLNRHRPGKREQIWCRTCMSYVMQMRDAAAEGVVTWEGYYTEPTFGGFMVGCIYVDNCEWQSQARSYADAEQLAFRHIATEHNTSSLLGKPAEPDTPDYTNGRIPF